MIVGKVNSDEGRIRLTIRGLRGREREIEAVIDTGFTASITLPGSLIDALKLRWQSLERCMLADGTECLFDVYEASVMWDGKVRRVLVDEADTPPLVGMGLLSGYELKMQVRTRGKVTIKRLPSK
jgi:clan AA aspartic protease